MFPWYFWVLLLIYAGICIFLILVILLQAGKGGGLSSLVGGSSSLGDAVGATGMERTLNRWTTFGAASFAVLAVLLTLIGSVHTKPTSIVEGLSEPLPSATEAPFDEGELLAPPGEPLPGTEGAAPAGLGEGLAPPSPGADVEFEVESALSPDGPVPTASP